jgi:hypothetical protein
MKKTNNLYLSIEIRQFLNEICENHSANISSTDQIIKYINSRLRAMDRAPVDKNAKYYINKLISADNFALIEKYKRFVQNPDARAKVIQQYAQDKEELMRQAEIKEEHERRKIIISMSCNNKQY